MKKVLSILLISAVFFISVWAIIMTNFASDIFTDFVKNEEMANYLLIELEGFSEDNKEYIVSHKYAKFVFGRANEIEKIFRSPANYENMKSVKIKNLSTSQEINNKEKNMYLKNGENIIQVEYFNNDYLYDVKKIKLINKLYVLSSS